MFLMSADRIFRSVPRSSQLRISSLFELSEMGGNIFNVLLGFGELDIFEIKE